MGEARVLVVLREDLSQSHGGALWALNMLQNLARVPKMALMVVSFGENAIKEGNRTVVESLGFDYLFVPSRPPTSEPAPRHSIAAERRLRRLLEERYYFLGEKECRRQTHVDDVVATAIRTWRPDLIVINDLWSSLLVPTILSGECAYCFIALDDYIAYQLGVAGGRGELGRHRLLPRLPAGSHWVANLRIKRYLNRVYRRCSGVVTLTQRDIPRDLNSSVATAVLPPVLERRSARWRYCSTRSVFFVGNVQFFPNRVAIEWICSRLAPELFRLDRTIRINIVGATGDEIRGGGVAANVSFMGYANKYEVVHHMSHDDLFIAPIATPFGAKLKLAECVAHGMPIVATDAALSGLPFLTSVPRIDLGQPASSARVVKACMEDPQGLIAMSRRNDLEAENVRSQQAAGWEEVLRRSMRGRQP